MPYTPTIGSPTHRRLLQELLQRNSARLDVIKRLHAGASGPARELLFELATDATLDQRDIYEMMHIIAHSESVQGGDK
jgi:hypothetical protein